MFQFRAPGDSGYGGSWPGYTFGTLAALLIVWLAWLGIRKRQYNRATNTKAWLSAHVYLGCLVLLLATLHSGFELGLNLHSLVYLLAWVVVGSGIYGVIVFSRVPQRLTDTMGDDTLASLTLQLRDIDKQARSLALTLPDRYNTLIADASQKTLLQGTPLQYVLNRVGHDCPTARAIEGIVALNPTAAPQHAHAGREVYALMLRRQGLVRRIRSAHRLMMRMRFWLVLHVPTAMALLVSLVAHIVSVFMYW